MKRFISVMFFVVVAMLLVAPSAFADTISGSGSWQSWVTGDVNNGGSPFWDNHSGDAYSNGNIGYIMTNQSPYGSSWPGTVPYWGTSIGSTGYDTSFTFKNDSSNWVYWIGVEDILRSNSDKDYNDMIVKMEPAGNSLKFTLLKEVAGYANYNEFGYRDTVGTVTVFSKLEEEGATHTFTPNGDYSFYFKSTPPNQSSVEWKTNHDNGGKQFAVFGQEVTQVPEPTTMLLLGFGLIGLAVSRRTVKG